MRCINTIPSGPKPVAITMLGEKCSKPQRRIASGELSSNAALTCFNDSGVHSMVSTPLSIWFFEMGRGWGWGDLCCCVFTIIAPEILGNDVTQSKGIHHLRNEPINLLTQMYHFANDQYCRRMNALCFFNNVGQCANQHQLILRSALSNDCNRRIG